MGKFAAIRWQNFWIWTAKWFEMVSLIIALTAQLYQSKRIRSSETGEKVDGGAWERLMIKAAISIVLLGVGKSL